MSCKKPDCDCIEQYEKAHGEPPKYGYPCLHPDEDLAKEMKKATEAKIAAKFSYSAPLPPSIDREIDTEQRHPDIMKQVDRELVRNGFDFNPAS